MKKLTILLTAVLITASIWAQSPQKMSYQAVIRNTSNSLVTNTAVGMQISILQTTSTGTAVYVETQTPTTNANGLVSLEIGGGTVVSGTFSSIDWSAGPYFIKTETDPTGGTTYTITGTSQLLSVPYALSAGNVTGLEKITEGGKTGWRLIGQDPANYGNIGSIATDLSYSSASSPTNGATGNFSSAMGFETTASGNSSTALGLFTVASGKISMAMGNNTQASGAYSTAMGDHTSALGDHSTAMGFAIGAYSYASVAMGQYNTAGGNATTWVTTDPLFEIGNGADASNLSNALTVLKNGTIIAPSVTNALITTAGAKALITKEYADTNLTASGLEKITDGWTGWRLIGQNLANYGNIGNNAVDLSYSNFASTTMGATGSHATALGYNTTALGVISSAMGGNTTASGRYSTAMGGNTTASGESSTAMGYYTTAKSYASVAIGRYNIGASTDSINWVTTDPLFEIGNGSFGSTSNALTVLKNGKVKINSSNIPEALRISSTIADNYFTFYNSLGYKGYVGIYNGDNDMDFGTGSSNTTGKVNLVIGAVPKLTVNSDGNVGIGISQPSSKLDVNGVIRAQTNNWPTTGRGLELAYDANWGGSLNIGAGYIQAYSRDKALYEPLFVGATEFDPVNDNSTRLGSSVNRWKAVYAVNGTIQTSDRRLKKNINTINYGLETVMKLRPVSYRWKKGNQDLNLGLIAQEVQKLIPEVIDVGNDKAKTLGMKYTELIPVLIKATQEQEKTIETQQKEINELKKLVNSNTYYKKLLGSNETQQKEIRYLKIMVNQLLQKRILVSN